jgi:hypothetical protein
MQAPPMMPLTGVRMDLSDQAIKNLTTLAGFCLSGKVIQDTPETMSMLWADVAAANKYLDAKNPPQETLKSEAAEVVGPA